MLYNNFGNSDLKVSVLGFGAGEIGDFGIEDKKVEELLNYALDNGINLIDTARGYYASENRIGRFLSKRRNEFVLSTKLGYGIEGEEDWSYNSVIKGLEDALKTLQTEYIDIVHLHSCDLSVLKRGEVIEALQKGKQEGKIRFMAYSGENEELSYATDCECFDSIQTSFNICDQRNLRNVFPKTIKKGMGLIAKRPLANAPWKYSEQPYGSYVEEYWKRLIKMNIQLDKDWYEYALRFSLFTAGVSSGIIGTTSIEHLKANISLVEKGALPAEDYNLFVNKFIENDDNWVGQI